MFLKVEVSFLSAYQINVFLVLEIDEVSLLWNGDHMSVDILRQVWMEMSGAILSSC